MPLTLIDAGAGGNSIAGFLDSVSALKGAAIAIVRPDGSFFGQQVVANPSSTLTRPNDTTAYAANDIIANNVTAGSVVVPSVSVARVAGGSGKMRRFRLASNVTTGWGAVVILVEFWSSAPTVSGGDNAAYAIATGAANFLGSTSITLAQLADGANGIGVSGVGSEIGFRLASGQVVYWTMKITTGTPTPIANQTFTLTVEVDQD